MGTHLGPIIQSKEINISDLAGKRLVVDAFNILYQFLTTIRQQDGSFLTDSKGRITSHLSGLFFRTANLMRSDIKLAFVFDGEAPALKKAERERRRDVKEDAEKKYALAEQEGDLELMKKYASRTTRLTHEQIEESKELLQAMGLPVVQAPSEGEAQASHMVSKGDFYAVVSQDTDSMIFGASRIVKNLSITGRKKTRSGYGVIMPELVSLQDNLERLDISREQLIVISMLCGTDFNIGGIKGIGPKKGLELVKRVKDFEQVFAEARWNDHFSTPWQEVYDTIIKMPVASEYDLRWGQVDKQKIYELLIEKHEFSKERVEKSLDEIAVKTAQKGLGEFF
jgi:flap endonuclease-1